MGRAYDLTSRCEARTTSVNNLAASSLCLLTVEYSSSVRSWMSAFRSDGITYAGLCFARRPTNDDGHLSHLELFVVERNEEGADVLRLCKVTIELLLRTEL